MGRTAIMGPALNVAQMDDTETSPEGKARFDRDLKRLYGAKSSREDLRSRECVPRMREKIEGNREKGGRGKSKGRLRRG